MFSLTKERFSSILRFPKLIEGVPLSQLMRTSTPVLLPQLVLRQDTGWGRSHVVQVTSTLDSLARKKIKYECLVYIQCTLYMYIHYTYTCSSGQKRNLRTCINVSHCTILFYATKLLLGTKIAIISAKYKFLEANVQ